MVRTNIVISTRSCKLELIGSTNDKFTTIKLPTVGGRMRDATIIRPNYSRTHRNRNVGRSEAGVGDGDMDGRWL